MYSAIALADFSMEINSGTYIAKFYVDNPDDWVRKIKKFRPQESFALKKKSCTRHGSELTVEIRIVVSQLRIFRNWYWFRKKNQIIDRKSLFK